MISAIKNRNPWVAAAIILLISPLVGMCYLNRGALALLYFGGAIFLFMLTLNVLAFHVPGVSISDQLSVISFPVAMVAAIHGVVIARRRDRSEHLKWYARRLAIVPLLCFVTPLVVLAGIRSYLYRPFDAPTNSMSPTLNSGDYFLISERAYDDEDPRYGDVVVFNAPTLKAAYAKRIVALPGDRVQMVAGTLHLNGVAIPKQSLSAPVGGIGNGRQFVETLPGGKQYRTLDMIDGGPLDDTAEYTVPLGHYFVVGDNRDDSTDSRGEIGFVDRRDILGKVILRFWDGTRHWIDDSKIQ